MPCRRDVAACFLIVLAALGLACSAPASTPADRSAPVERSALFTNGGFETGVAGAVPPSWVLQPSLNPNPGGFTVQSPQTPAGLNLTAGGLPLTSPATSTRPTGRYMFASCTRRCFRTRSTPSTSSRTSSSGP